MLTPATTPAFTSVGTFVLIPGGKFRMGSPTTEANHEDDERQHEVSLNPFEMGETVVTQEVNGTQIPLCPDYPVENVSWNDAMTFIAEVNHQLAGHGYTYFLPTEAQTEYAFRGRTTTAYVSGEDNTELGKYVIYSANSREQTQPVKLVFPNAFGIYRGGVWEWTRDWYNDKYKGSTGLDPRGPASGEFCVYRGGSCVSTPPSSAGQPIATAATPTTSITTWASA
jgi:formylglycine-generating enzyme required for sulfatase activity